MSRATTAVSRTLLLSGFLFALSHVLGQGSASAFEAATIKPSKENFGSSGWDTHPGRIDLHGQTLKGLLVIAYRVERDQVIGGPKWVDGDRFDVSGKAAGPAGDVQLLEMLQTFLAERFHLLVHREKKIVTGYALVATKSGLKIKPVEAPKGTSADYSKGRISARGVTMAKLADTLSRLVDGPVADMTGVQGAFDVQFQWAATGDATDSVSELAAALEDRTGLKLESRKVPVDLLVVDRAEPPSEN